MFHLKSDSRLVNGVFSTSRALAVSLSEIPLSQRKKSIGLLALDQQ